MHLLGCLEGKKPALYIKIDISALNLLSQSVKPPEVVRREKN